MIWGCFGGHLEDVNVFFHRTFNADFFTIMYLSFSIALFFHKCLTSETFRLPPSFVGLDEPETLGGLYRPLGRCFRPLLYWPVAKTLATHSLCMQNLFSLNHLNQTRWSAPHLSIFFFTYFLKSNFTFVKYYNTLISFNFYICKILIPLPM